jgi:hypothetical protein
MDRKTHLPGFLHHVTVRAKPDFRILRTAGSAPEGSQASLKVKRLGRLSGIRSLAFTGAPGLGDGVRPESG